MSVIRNCTAIFVLNVACSDTTGGILCGISNNTYKGGGYCSQVLKHVLTSSQITSSQLHFALSLTNYRFSFTHHINFCTCFLQVCSLRPERLQNLQGRCLADSKYHAQIWLARIVMRAVGFIYP